jgi:hypothetical protein
MKRLKLAVKPKKLKLSPTLELTTQHQRYDIDQLLEQYHINSKENKNLPYFKWIKYSEHFPLDNKEPILIYDVKYSRMYDTLSFIGLQHYLLDRYNKYDNEPSHWMRLKLPEV